jgi:hypothetical protein
MSEEKNLFISKQYFHHHAYEILTAHKDVKAFLENSFDAKIDLTERVKFTKGRESDAIKADDLNKEIRRLLSYNKEFKFEVSEEMGVFYFSASKSSIGGFDFALINHKVNLVKLRNICFGEIHYSDNFKRWNKFLDKNPELKEYAEYLITSENVGVNIPIKKDDFSPPLIVHSTFLLYSAKVSNCLCYLIQLQPYPFYTYSTTLRPYTLQHNLKRHSLRR